MKYKLVRQDGVVEYRCDSSTILPLGAIELTDAEYLSGIPLPTPTLQQVKAVAISNIEATYHTAITENIPYMGTFFQADKESQSLIADVLTAQAGVAPVGFGWYDINNNKTSMTNAQLQGLSNAIFLRGIPLFDKKQTLKAAIRAATTEAQVKAIVW